MPTFTHYIIERIAGKSNLFGIFFLVRVEDEETGKVRTKLELMEVIGNEWRLFRYLEKEFLW